jgi:uncharacterized membrane protein
VGVCSVGDAEATIDKIKAPQSQQLINIQDAAIVTGEVGKRKPNTRQLHSLAGVGALGGACWGMVFGLLLFVPLLGAAIGAGIGALAGSLTERRIDDKFINGVSRRSHLERLPRSCSPPTSSDRVRTEWSGTRTK